jgi:hypothetical protein
MQITVVENWSHSNVHPHPERPMTLAADPDPAAARPAVWTTLPGTTDSPGITDREKFFFDLNGFLVLRGAIGRDHLTAINAILDRFIDMDPPLRHNEWVGGVHAHTFGGKDGVNLQQIYEAGEPFERLIDHPNWIDKVKCFVGGQDNFDSHHGPLFIDENFVSLRGPGEAIGVHSGGHEIVKRCQYRVLNGKFGCGQINVLMAFNDVGPGDGPTMVIPGSHKASFPHPEFDLKRIRKGEATSVDGMEGAVEVHLRAGDALLFVDALMHGSALRVNEGLRRIAVYRYGPSWGFFRHPYRPTAELLQRLTPQRRQIVMPHPVVRREPNRIKDFPQPPEAE